MVTVPEGSYENMVFQGPKVWGKVRHVNNECVVFYTPGALSFQFRPLKDIPIKSLSKTNIFRFIFFYYSTLLLPYIIQVFMLRKEKERMAR